MSKKCYISTCNSNSNRNQTKLYCIPQTLTNHRDNWETCQRNKFRRHTLLTNLKCESNIPAKIYVCENHFVTGTINCLHVRLKLVTVFIITLIITNRKTKSTIWRHSHRLGSNIIASTNNCNTEKRRKAMSGDSLFKPMFKQEIQNVFNTRTKQWQTQLHHYLYGHNTTKRTVVEKHWMHWTALPGKAYICQYHFVPCKISVRNVNSISWRLT